MCKTMPGHCFSDAERKTLQDKGWTEKQIDFVEKTEVEDKIKEFLK